MYVRRTLLASAIAMAFAMPAQADNSDDIAAIRKEIEAMRQNYEARIQALEAQLKQAERHTSQAKADAAEPTAADHATPPAAANSFNPEIGLILTGRYANLKDVPNRHITGFLPLGPAAAGMRRGFTADASELSLAADIDPDFRGQANLVYEDGTGATVEEAYFQTLSLGSGFTLKGGRFRSAIGYMNEQHPHAWDFVDNPLMYQALFGEGYGQDGVQLKWLAPTDLLVELTGELGRGADFPGSDRNKNGAGDATLGLHLGGDVGLSNSWRGGIAYLRTRAENRAFFGLDPAGTALTGDFTGRSRTWLADFIWKWTPNGNPRETNFKFQTEWFQRSESGSLACTRCIASPYASEQSGWYAQSVYQFMPMWRIGYRYDRLDRGTARLDGADIGSTIASLADYSPSRHSLMLDWSPSEFSLVRLQYARDKSMAGLAENQVALQYVYSLGAHGAHKY